MTPSERKRAIWRIGLTYGFGMAVWIASLYSLGPIAAHFGGHLAGWPLSLASIPFGWVGGWLCWQVTRKPLGP